MAGTWHWYTHSCHWTRFGCQWDLDTLRAIGAYDGANMRCLRTGPVVWELQVYIQ